MKITVEQVIEAIRDAGLEPREYSGRGMYGKHCLGVDTERDMLGPAIAIAANLIDNGAEPRDVERWGEGTDYDGMGMGRVLYWPSMELTEAQLKEFGLGEDDDDE